MIFFIYQILGDEIMKKISVLLIVLSLFFSLTIPKEANAQISKDSKSIEQIFLNDLITKSKSTNPIEKETAIENLNVYKNFDEKTKQEFLKIVQDPNLIEKNIIVTKGKENTTSQNNNFTTYAAKATTSNKTIRKNFDFKILGIKVYGIHLELDYKVKAARPVSTTKATSYVTYSYHPLATIKQIDISHKIATDGQAYAKAKYSYAMNPFRGLNYQAGVQAVSIAGDGVGNLVYTNAWKE